MIIYWLQFFRLNLSRIPTHFCYGFMNCTYIIKSINYDRPENTRKTRLIEIFFLNTQNRRNVKYKQKEFMNSSKIPELLVINVSKSKLLRFHIH